MINKKTFERKKTVATPNSVKQGERRDGWMCQKCLNILKKKLPSTIALGLFFVFIHPDAPLL